MDIFDIKLAARTVNGADKPEENWVIEHFWEGLFARGRWEIYRKGEKEKKMRHLVLPGQFGASFRRVCYPNPDKYGKFGLKKAEGAEGAKEAKEDGDNEEVVEVEDQVVAEDFFLETTEENEDGGNGGNGDGHGKGHEKGHGKDAAKKASAEKVPLSIIQSANFECKKTAKGADELVMELQPAHHIFTNGWETRVFGYGDPPRAVVRPELAMMISFIINRKVHKDQAARSGRSQGFSTLVETKEQAAQAARMGTGDGAGAGDAAAAAAATGSHGGVETGLRRIKSWASQLKKVSSASGTVMPTGLPKFTGIGMALEVEDTVRVTTDHSIWHRVPLAKAQPHSDAIDQITLRP